MNFKSLYSFLALTFGLSWGVVALLIAFPDQIASIFGELDTSNPLFILAVYAPAIAAFILVLKQGSLKNFLKRLLLWRVHWGWYAFLIAGIPALFYAGAFIKGEPFTTPALALLPALFFMLFLGPVEEFGWRGLALPLLQQRLQPLWAALILGFIWGVWHLPAFFLSGTPQSNWSFFPFLIGAIALSIIVTPLFNASQGSLLLPILFHWQLINPYFPDAAPHDTWLFVAAAIIIAVIYRKELFTKGVTEPIPA